ncbi:MAG: TatD family hydrolase [Acidimicrobiia bacterium]|nr:TatD family hydrolase [Acidimicrobiia bacterium]
MHAHIESGIAPAELDHLRACIVSVTRSLAEFREVEMRTDRAVAWGVGCHPGLARAVRTFSPHVLRAALAATAVVGEVGLDGSARVPLDAQKDVFDQVIGVLAETPRIVSVHSYRATKEVLDILERHRPEGVVLHWWLGNDAATERAVDLGAYFSVNASQVGKWAALRLVPLDRILTETDHPFGDRGEEPPRRPGNVSIVERRLADELGFRPEAIRRRVWQNLARLVDELGLHDLLPRQFQVQLLAS